MASVWLGKSLLAELTSDVAALCTFVSCVLRPLMSPLETALDAALGRSLMEDSRSLRSEQYAGLLLPPHPVAATSAAAMRAATTGRRPTSEARLSIDPP